MKLIVGLGNIGDEYKKTRHNVGFMIVDELAKTFQSGPFKDKMGGFYTIVTVFGEQVMLLKPGRYMNLSGEVISFFLHYFHINIVDMLIICDDMHLGIGKFKIKPKGSSAGHNGLKNIEVHLGTNQYNRLKVGIDKNSTNTAKDYVLSPFNSMEYGIIQLKIMDLIHVVEDFITKDITFIMNKYNTKDE